MDKSQSANKIGEIPLQGWIALIFTPMAVVFSLLFGLAQLYGFLQDKPVHLIILGLAASLLLSLLIWVIYTRSALFRSLLDWLVHKARTVGSSLLRFAHSKWGYRAVAVLFLFTMLGGQWLVFRSISSVALLALNTLLLLSLIVLLIDRRTALGRGIQPTMHIDTFDHGLTQWEAEDLGRATINEGMGLPPPSLDLFPVHDIPSLKYVLAFRGIPEFRRGTIECDVRLTPNSLLNILFMADIHGRQFYMARLDNRPQWRDSFLEMEPDYPWWEYRAQSQTITPAQRWVHIQLEVTPTSAILYRDHDEVLRIALANFHHKPQRYQIGLFTEGGAVFVDNFAVTIG